MTPENEKQPNPMHRSETSGVETMLSEFTDEPGGAPLDSEEVVARNRRRMEQLKKDQEQSSSE